METEKTNEEKQQTIDTFHESRVNCHLTTSLSELPSTVLDWMDHNISEVIILWDQKGKALFTSDSVKNKFGYEKSEIIGSYWYQFISPKEIDIVRENFDENSAETQRFTLYVLNKENKYVWTECTLRILRQGYGREDIVVTALKDITESKETEELMIRSEKMSIAGQLSAAIAHEVRNPLTSIKGFLQLMQAGGEQKDEYYRIMIDEIEKIENITSELLSIAKPITENYQMEPLLDMINEVVTLLEPQAKVNDVMLAVQEPVNEIVLCDRSQIKQVLINIVKNAIEAMDTPGEITLFTERTENAVKINVKDEGPGVPEEIIDRLGEPFLTTKKHGTGLGLMITKQLLEKHGASLHIKNNPNKGCTFQLLFPLGMKEKLAIDKLAND